MKSTPTRGVKQHLKPDTYKQWEPAHLSRNTEYGEQNTDGLIRSPYSVFCIPLRRAGDRVPFVLWVSDLK